MSFTTCPCIISAVGFCGYSWLWKKMNTYSLHTFFFVFSYTDTNWNLGQEMSVWKTRTYISCLNIFVMTPVNTWTSCNGLYILFTLHWTGHHICFIIEEAVQAHKSNYFKKARKSLLQDKKNIYVGAKKVYQGRLKRLDANWMEC